MGAMRAAVAAVLSLYTAVAASGQCVTDTRLLSTRQTKPNLVAGPVAWSGSVLGVAKTEENVTTAIWFAGYDEALQTLVPDRLVANDAEAIVGLEWTGTEFGLFYRTVNRQLLLQRITMMGELIGGPIAITPSRPVSSGDEIEVEWSSAVDGYVVARNISQITKGTWVTFVSRDGTHRADRKLPVFVAAQSNLSLSVTETGTVGVFFVNTGGGISFMRLTETAIPVSNTVTATPANYIETAAQGNRFVVTYSVPDGGKTEIRWLVVDTSHQLVRAEELLLEGPGDDVWPLALIANDGELALAYLETADRDEALDKYYRLHRFTIDGTSLADTYVAATEIGTTARAESTYDPVWTGTSYLQAAVRRTPDRLNSYLLRHCPLRATVGTDVAAGRPNRPVTYTALPEGGVPGYKYEWRFSDTTRVFQSQSVARTYEDAGTYTATVTVTDNARTTVTTTYTIDIVNVKRRSARH